MEYKEARINYIKQLNAFYKFLPNNPVSANAQCLYSYLLNKNSELNWIEEFTVSNMIVCGLTSLSRQSLDRARNELKQKGYIEYKKGHSNQAGTYVIVSFDTQSDTQNDTQNDTQSGHTLSTLNKQKENINININLNNNKGALDFSVATMEEFEMQIKDFSVSEQFELKSEYLQKKHSWVKV